MSERELRIEEWFDANNTEHLAAYKMFLETGRWPSDFFPSYVVLGDSWNMVIRAMIVNKHLEAAARESGITSFTPVEAIKVMRDALVKEVENVKVSKVALEDLLDKLDDVRDDVNKAFSSADTCLDQFEDGLARIDDGIEELKDAVSELDDVD
jgi:hypothetical protein